MINIFLACTVTANISYIRTSIQIY